MQPKRMLLFILIAAIALVATSCAAPTPETIIITQEVEVAGETVIQTVEVTVPPPEVAPTEEPWAPLTMEDFTSANIDWTAVAAAGPAEGITIHVAALSHPYINALRPYVPLFEKLTGISVAYDVLPVEEFWLKTAADLSGGTGFYDIVMNGTEFEWAYMEAGWTYDLNEFLNNPELTDLEWYNIDDFYPYDFAAHAWNGEYGIGTYGMGSQNAIPVNSEPLMLICNGAKLEEAGLPGPPTTWEEWAEYAAAMTGDGEYGVVQRGARDYSLMYGYAPGFFAYSEYDLDPETLKPIYNCPLCVEYTQLYGDTLRNYGPPGQTNIGWDGVISNMAAGVVGCTIDDMAFADTYENCEASQICETAVYANPPAGPTGNIRIPLWQWALSINAATSRPEAAWLFLEWATSSPVMTVVSTEQLSMLPVRQSVWESEHMMEVTADWGNYREVIDNSRQYWGNFYTVQPHMVAMTAPWVDAIQAVILGEKDAQTALDEAVIASETILRDAGLYDE